MSVERSKTTEVIAEPPLQVTLVEPNADSPPTCAWRVSPGTVAVFDVRGLDAPLPNGPAVYIVVHDFVVAFPLFVGTTTDRDRTGDVNRRRWSAARQAGANGVHVLCASNPESARAMAQYLIDGHQPPFNRRSAA